MRKVNVGVIGCGNISSIYLKNCSEMFDTLEVKACADLVREHAESQAEKFGVPKVCTVEELLSDKEIDIVLNLTIPQAHYEVNMKALEAGKHVYCEKPFALNREDAKKVLKLSEEKNLLVGCAPDTFLGAGIQTCRKLIDDGWIGKPVAATAFMTCHGHESWHPSPEFYYKKGGGPMLDMGPYYLTALVNLIGPVKRVAGSAKITFPERTITSEPKYGQKITVETPTHLAGTIDFENGAIGTIITSFDVWSANLPRIEIYGELGSISVPDPNTFGGPIKVKLYNDSEWREIPFLNEYPENSRGLGLADMASMIGTDGKHRASGKLAAHVLDVMLSFQESSESGMYKNIEIKCERPAAFEVRSAAKEL